MAGGGDLVSKEWQTITGGSPSRINNWLLNLQPPYSSATVYVAAAFTSIFVFLILSAFKPPFVCMHSTGGERRLSYPAATAYSGLAGFLVYILL